MMLTASDVIGKRPVYASGVNMPKAGVAATALMATRKSSTVAAKVGRDMDAPASFAIFSTDAIVTCR